MCELPKNKHCDSFRISVDLNTPTLDVDAEEVILPQGEAQNCREQVPQPLDTVPTLP